ARRPAGGGAEHRGPRPGLDRPGSAAVRRWPGAGFHRRAGTRAGGVAPLRLPVALRRPARPQHLRLAAGARGPRRATPHRVKRLLAAAAMLAALAYPLLAHGAAAFDSGALALAATAVLLVLLLLPALRRGAVAAWLALPATAGALAWLFLHGRALLPLYLVPVLLNLLVAW